MAMPSVLFALLCCCCCLPMMMAQEGDCRIEYTDDFTNSQEEMVDYLLVGAGGASLQMALYINKLEMGTYAILERNSVVGSFWTKFPRYKELISINKYVRNETQKERYDWHSLLEAPLKMADVTDDYFPTGQDWQKYMSLVAEKTGIIDHIEFNTEVDHMALDGSPCVYVRDDSKGEGQLSKRCARRRVFIGTGLREKNQNEQKIYQAMGGIPYSESSKELAKHRRVCILGNGNSGYEIAQNVYGVAERTIIYGNRPNRLSSATKYTGDVRVKYLQVVENLNAKAVDTSIYFYKLYAVGGTESWSAKKQFEIARVTRTMTWLRQHECEVFFYATGFESSVPGVRGSGFPPTEDWYLWPGSENIHLIGWLMHKRDFQQGAGGFLSGFRYLIRNLALQVKADESSPPYFRYPMDVLTADQVIQRVVDRAQLASDLVIMQDGVVLRDVIAPNQAQQGTYRYYEGVNYEFHHNSWEFDINSDDVISFYFSWSERYAGYVFDQVYRFNDTGTLANVYLHPAIQVGANKVRHMHEDLDMEWRRPPYQEMVRDTITNALAGDLSAFTPIVKFEPRFTQFPAKEEGFYQPADLGQLEHQDTGVVMSLIRCVEGGATGPLLETVREKMKGWMPYLFDQTLYGPTNQLN